MIEEASRADGFAAYLAKRLIADKRFQPGVPEEAAALVQESNLALFNAELALQVACIVDREKEPDKRFGLSQKDTFDLARACLKHTGTVNGAKMPVSIIVYEVGAGPPSDADRARLKELHKNFPLAKVILISFYIDAVTRTVWSPGAFNGLMRGRRWVERVLREPRKQDAELVVPEAALPSQTGRPVVTALILLVLTAAFVIEHLANSGSKSTGLLGVGVGTLFALGGMNVNAAMKDGEWYRLFSAALLHADAFHLLLNGVALGLAGVLLESLVGGSWLLGLFFLGAAGGSLMGLAVNPDNIVSIGASGAVMGLLSAALVLAMRFPRGATRVQIQGRLLQFLIPSLIPLATSRHEGKVDYAAHFGGALVGLAAGYAIYAIWPKGETRPRFPALGKAMAAVSVLTFGVSAFLVKEHYGAYAAEVAYTATAELLVDDDKIPKDTATAKRDVDTWGKGHPRDPRVHLFRALRLLDQGDDATAEVDLRAALGEREILDRAFGNKKLEIGIRAVLCELLLRQNRREEARREALPVCKAEGGSAPEQLRDLGLCE